MPSFLGRGIKQEGGGDVLTPSPIGPKFLVILTEIVHPMTLGRGSASLPHSRNPLFRPFLAAPLSQGINWNLCCGKNNKIYRPNLERKLCIFSEVKFSNIEDLKYNCLQFDESIGPLSLMQPSWLCHCFPDESDFSTLKSNGKILNAAGCF